MPAPPGRATSEVSSSEPSESAMAALQGIVKRFDRLTALDGVDFDVRRGEIHGLLGENGAGKTTLMNILFGLVRPDAGTITVDGEPVRLRDPHDAVGRGVGMVHQHFMLVPTLTVAENVLLGERGGLVVGRRKLANVSERLRSCAERYGLEVDPSVPVWKLSVGEQQRAEVLRALYRNARILILDEPTATLTPFEAEQLLPRLRAMAAEGTAVVFITHHLDEVITHTDRITVLRGGRHVATLRPAETTTRELARMMVGRDVSPFAVGLAIAPAPGPGTTIGTAAPSASLEIVGLEAGGAMGDQALRGLDLSVARGEIVAIAGVEGNGQAELEEVLIGLRRPTAGGLLLDGQEITALGPADRLSRGIGVIPSDRYRRGLIRAMSVAENLVLDRIGEDPYGRPFSLSPKAIFANARRQVESFSIRASSPEQPAGSLSGGSAQRIVLARALSRELRLLVAAQPSRGLDVGAMEFVWGELDAQRRAGVGTLLISTDLNEVFALADRCAVMYRGRIVAEWGRSEFDRERFGLAMGGVLEVPRTEETTATVAGGGGSRQ